jgi:hypothetical protein
MPQTTGAMSQSGHASVIEVNLNKVTPDWKNISGSASSFEVGDISFMSGEAWTFEGISAIVSRGKMEPVEVTVNGLYSATAGEIWEQILFAKSSADGFCQVRIFPKGKTSGAPVFTTSSEYSYLVGITPPTFSAEEASPVPAGFTVKTSDVTESTYTT